MPGTESLTVRKSLKARRQTANVYPTTPPNPRPIQNSVEPRARLTSASCAYPTTRSSCCMSIYHHHGRLARSVPSVRLGSIASGSASMGVAGDVDYSGANVEGVRRLGVEGVRPLGVDGAAAR